MGWQKDMFAPARLSVGGGGGSLPPLPPASAATVLGGVLLDFKALDIGQGSRIPIVPPLEVAKPCRFLRELPNQAWYLSHNKKGIHR